MTGFVDHHYLIAKCSIGSHNNFPLTSSFQNHPSMIYLKKVTGYLEAQNMKSVPQDCL